MSVGVGLCAAIIGALAAVGWVVAVADSAPNLSQITPSTPHPPTVIYAADGTRLGYVHADTIFNPLTTAQIPPLMKEATVAIEDRRFYHHGALDYQGILRAGIKDVFGGSGSLQGASTLTMQLVDNEYIPKLRQTRNLKYKITQAKLAMQLESKHSKNWILTSYLNDAPYGTVGGETARGVGAAAEMFFNRPVQDLNLAQTALLAGLPQAPSDYNPFIDHAHAEAALRRRHEVIKAMMKAGYITRHQGVEADHSPLQVDSSNPYTAAHVQPYVFDYVVKQLEDRYGTKEVQNGGLTVYTTITLKSQAQAQNAVDENPQYADAGTAAALASVDPTNGHIVALAATEDYSKTKFFYPVYAKRQTGSAAKVFALMTLIHDYDGDPNQTYYRSQPLATGWTSLDPTWSVHTDNYSYAGSISVAHATTISDNTVFAQLVVDETMPKFQAMAEAMGLPADQMIDAPAEVLGGWKNGITMLTMANADAILADGGVYHQPTIIDHVTFPDGHVDNWTDPGHRVFTPGEAYAATQVLKTVITEGTGTNANYGCPEAGKTGTAENLDNGWFVGYTPKLATAVWVGFPGGNVPMSNGFGNTVAAPLWRAFMQSAADGYCGDFPVPATLWTGQPFIGEHSDYKSPAFNPNGTSNPANQYGNSTLFAQPPQGTTTTTGKATTPGTGKGTGTGTGNGKGNGTGAGKGGGTGKGTGTGGSTGGTGGAGVPGGH